MNQTKTTLLGKIVLTSHVAYTLFFFALSILVWLAVLEIENYITYYNFFVVVLLTGIFSIVMQIVGRVFEEEVQK